jgi:hypothetical protein
VAAQMLGVKNPEDMSEEIRAFRALVAEYRKGFAG